MPEPARDLIERYRYARKFGSSYKALPRTPYVTAGMSDLACSRVDAAARERDMTRGTLVRALIEAIAEDDLFNAILEDA